jgi:cystathionine beta-lyase
MWVADMDFCTPPEIISALRHRLNHDIFGYTLVPEQLNMTIVDRMKTLYNWAIDKEAVIWLPGVVSGLNVACRAFGSAMAAIATTVPVYPPFLSAPSNCGIPLMTIPMKEQDHRYVLDLEHIETTFKKGVSLFMLCSPHNPCGTLFSRSELCALLDLCQTYDVTLCSDEIHADFVLDQGRQHLPVASISSEAADRTITLMAPSKTYNIPGLGASFAIVTNPELKNKFIHSRRGIVPDVNLLGLTAAQAAYAHCDQWLKQLIDYLRCNRDMVVETINRISTCRMLSIEATYLAWIDIRETGIKDPIQFFERAGIGLSDGAFFGQKGFVRLNFGCPASLLKKGLDRFENALK